MRVLHPGEAARKLFRLRPLAGSVQRIAARSELRTSLRDGGSRTLLPPTPGIQLILRADVTRIGPDGEAHYRFVFEQVDLLVQKGTPLRAIDVLREELAALPGLSGEGRVAADGRSTHFALTLPPTLPAPLPQPLQEMTAALSGLGTVLPPEPVGLGARWEATSGGTGPTARTPMVFTLKTLAADAIGVRLALNEPGEAEAAAATAPVRTRTRGRGGCLLAFDRLWPTRLELDVEAETHLPPDRTRSTGRAEGFTTARLRLRELSFTPPVIGARVIAG